MHNLQMDNHLVFGTTEPAWRLVDVYDGCIDAAPSLLQEIARIVVGDLPFKMRSIHVAIAQKDGAALKTTARSLRGALSILVKTQDLDELHQLELMGSENDLDGAQTLFEELRLKIGCLLQGLRQSTV